MQTSILFHYFLETMKKVISIGIGGYSFQIEEDAFQILQEYTRQFKAKLDETEDTSEIMDDIESRIAELLHEEVTSPNQVVGTWLIRQIVIQMGMPDGSNDYTEYQSSYTDKRTSRKLFRHTENRILGGVCSGLAVYFDIDTTALRIILFLTLFFGGVSFWIYLILWCCLPAAKTPAQKLQMQGIPVTAENLLRYAKQTGK